jgi:hypothetical protein
LVRRGAFPYPEDDIDLGMILLDVYQTARTPFMSTPDDPREGNTFVRWIKHAFAIDSPDQVQPNKTQCAVLEKLCTEVVRRRLTTPALFMLEMSRPLNYVSAQLLRFIEPIATVIANKNEYEHLTLFLEQRGSIDYICGRLEALETHCTKKEHSSLRAHEPHDKD